MNKNSPLLIDTHVWLWFVLGDQKLCKKARNLIEESTSKGMLNLSCISLWEVAMLESKGRIVFSKECNTWLHEASTMPGLNIVQITSDIAFDSSRLPSEFHGDPADRIIVATARSIDATLLTKDYKILEYSKTRYLKCLEA
ncbi:MAG: type II toxin-antitoxin system VapC family toxin [Fibrobacteres bacterium]|nr:type II toxin-antitoxin system VapC family toxin [Fibrobacterota bacterium]